jgi:hypothetical protein
MKYYSLKYNVIKDGKIAYSETIGIKSDVALTVETSHPVLVKKLNLPSGFSVEVTDKIDIGEPDYLRLEKRLEH